MPRAQSGGAGALRGSCIMPVDRGSSAAFLFLDVYG